jgi:hypothetical protein
VHKPLGQRADADAAKKKRKAQEERRRREDSGSSTKKGRRGFDADGDVLTREERGIGSGVRKQFALGNKKN